ncbi:MAG: ATP-binding protein [candidate division Zixibacteria bacterium]|nr:ATP-binding protein [candidate division Zixibacteria bacterium]
MEDLSLHILDIMENCVNAQARRIEIRINENPERDLLTLEILDDGKGMDNRTLQKATDPFFTTRKTRRFGLGLSMILESAKATGGELTVKSAPGKGTQVRVTFQQSHIDMKPLGDIPQTLLTLIAGHPDIELSYCHTIGREKFSFDTREIRDLPIGSPQVLRRIGEHIREGIDRLTKRAKNS